MTFINSVAGGFGVAVAVLTVLSVTNGLSTHLFDGETLEQKIVARVGA